MKRRFMGRFSEKAFANRESKDHGVGVRVPLHVTCVGVTVSEGA
jgi:hypothetical protein